MRYLFLFTVLCLGALTQCNDDSEPLTGCYDAALDSLWMDSVCSAECLGVCACNGVTYCNPCLAAQDGYYLLDSTRACGHAEYFNASTAGQ